MGVLGGISDVLRDSQGRFKGFQKVSMDLTGSSMGLKMFQGVSGVI